mgnify:CR=1 FL=1
MSSAESLAREDFSSFRGSTRSYVCPECSEGRSSRNQGRKCLRITFEEESAVWFCHNCESKGQIRMEESSPKETGLRVAPSYFLAGEKDLKHLGEIRGIDLPGMQEGLSDRLVLSTDIYFGDLGGKSKALGFRYENEEAIKWRSIEGKSYTQTGVCRGLFPSATEFKAGSTVVLTEGEWDCLAMRSCGYAAYSVPGGANLSAGAETPIYLKAIVRALTADQIDVVVAVDSDEKGEVFRDRILRHLGKERVGTIDWSEYGVKDANECLVTHGTPGIDRAMSDVRGVLYTGIVRASSLVGRINDIRSGGFKGGAKIGIPSVDKLYTVCSDQISVVTGIPGSGKSELIDAFMVNLAVAEDWKFAIFSAENPIDIHCGKLIEKFSGQPIFEGENKLGEEKLKEASTWVDDHFFFLDPASSNSLDSILQRAEVLVKHNGINGLVIDPFNYTDVPLETDAINSMLTRLHAAASKMHIHIWIVAHPAKLYRGEGGKIPTPGGMDISGSAAWFSKSDFGITVQRDPDGGTMMMVWKCRFRWLGETGSAHLRYDASCGRYSEGVSIDDIAAELGNIDWGEKGKKEKKEKSDGDEWWDA